MSISLAHKIALVFGAGSSGAGWSNGKAAAIAYARAGAIVAGVDIDSDRARDTANHIGGEGGRAFALRADVACDAQVRAAVAAVLKEFGRIDILHNNVAVAPAIGPLTDVTEEAFDLAMAVNVKGMFLACKYVLPIMVQQSCGAILNVSAVASLRYLGPAIAYTASKGAVNALTLGVAQEYARRGIRCNAIAPGFMDTPIGLGMYSVDPAMRATQMAARNARLPTGEPGDAWDVANAAVFLASDQARYITGVLLPVDGGYLGRGA